MDKRSFLKFFALASGSLLFADAAPGRQSAGVEALQELAQRMFAEILSHNDYYVNRQGEHFFEGLKGAQHPRATVIGCSDSHFQTHALDATPENDLFIIRNIGNQFTSAMGSVEYGVRRLHTPLLLIVGHSRCDAVQAAMGDYSHEGEHIIRELDSLSAAVRPVPFSKSPESQWLAAVAANVHQQIFYAIEAFKNEVESGKLTVVGVVYDLADDYYHGYGRLNIVNINGETDSAKILQSPMMQSLFKPAPV